MDRIHTPEPEYGGTDRMCLHYTAAVCLTSVLYKHWPPLTIAQSTFHTSRWSQNLAKPTQIEHVIRDWPKTCLWSKQVGWISNIISLVFAIENEWLGAWDRHPLWLYQWVCVLCKMRCDTSQPIHSMVCSCSLAQWPPWVFHTTNETFIYVQL